MSKHRVKPALVILAAGTGTRYGGLKQLEAVGPNGEAILDYSISDALQAGFGHIVLVVRREILALMKAHCDDRFGGAIDVQYAIQELEVIVASVPTRVSAKPLGTGHAVLSAAAYINTPFAVINADDYYGPTAFEKMSAFLCGSVSSRHFAMIGYSLVYTLSANGTVSRGVCHVNEHGMLTRIDEQQGLYRGVDGLPDDTLVSMSFWGLHPDLFDALQAEFDAYLHNGEYKDSEFFLPAVINKLILTQKLQVQVIPSREQWHGITHAADLKSVRAALSARSV